MKKLVLLLSLLLTCTVGHAGYDFFESNDKLTGTFTTALDVDGSNQVSLVAWIYRTAAQWAETSDSRCVQLNEDTADSSDQLELRTAAADEVRGGTRDSAGALSESDLSFTDGTYDAEWVVWVAIYTSNVSREVFIEDSTGGGVSTTSRDILAVDDIAIGNSTDGNFLDCEATLAEIAVFDTALSDAQIDALQTATGASAGGPPPCSVAPNNCVAYWPLDQDYGAGAGAVTNEATGSAADATGDLTVQSSAPYNASLHPIISAAGKAVERRRRSE
jgi:hypothetical protein